MGFVAHSCFPREISSQGESKALFPSLLSVLSVRLHVSDCVQTLGPHSPH